MTGEVPRAAAVDERGSGRARPLWNERDGWSGSAADERVPRWRCGVGASACAWRCWAVGASAGAGRRYSEG